MATVQLARRSLSYDQRCEFYGSMGECINNVYDYRCRASFPERYAEAFKAEMDSFAECMAGRQSPSVTRKDCLATFCVAEACGVSAQRGERVTVKYEGSGRGASWTGLG